MVAATDNFSSYATGKDAPAEHAAAVTPHDSNNLTYTTRALWVGVAGNISIETAGGESAVILKGAVGLVPVRVPRVNNTSTTATDIVALW